MVTTEFKSYIKTILVSVGLLSVVYFYMFCNFWWGNHDWGYLKSGASVESGLFEARYSQHLFTLLFLDGHILPILTFLCGFVCISIQAILIGKYFNLSSKSYVCIALFIGVNPHIYALFYYVYLFFPFVVWSLVGCLLLFLTEGCYRVWKYLVAVCGYVLLLGSYPPNLALIFVLFAGKRVLLYAEGKENLKNVFVRMVFWAGQVIVSVVIYKIIYNCLLDRQLINTDMYNIKTKSIMEILSCLPLELWNSVSQLFYGFSFMGGWYFLPLFVLAVVAFWVLMQKDKNKFVMFLGFVFVLLMSRFSFIVSSHSEYAIFRLMYWGRLGVYLFCLAVLFNEHKKLVKNILFIILVVFFVKNVTANYEIQKVQNFGFVVGRSYQKKLIDTIALNPKFDKNAEYISFSFGQPNFREKFYSDKYKTGELIGLKLVFEFDMVNFLFWEEVKSPVIIGAGISGNLILRVDRGGKEKWASGDYWQNNPQNMEKIRYWLYVNAKPYPSDDAVYVDDKYLILVLDPHVFYKRRELVARSLDK